MCFYVRQPLTVLVFGVCLVLWMGICFYEDFQYQAQLTTICELIAIFLCTSLFVYSFFKAMLTSPGRVPRTQMWKEGLFISESEEMKFLSIIHANPIPDELEPETEIDLFFLCVRMRKIPTIRGYLHRLLKSREALLHGDVLLCGVRKWEGFMRFFPLVHRSPPLSGQRRDACDGRRYCIPCQHFMPDRAHHCRICNACTLRMDHHCPWLANCVGIFNYRFFFLSLLYGGLSLIFCAYKSLSDPVPLSIYGFRPTSNVAFTSADSTFPELGISSDRVSLHSSDHEHRPDSLFFSWPHWPLLRATVESCRM
jgi:hypothetical protein